MIKPCLHAIWYLNQNTNTHSINDEFEIIEMTWKGEITKVKTYSIRIGKEYEFGIDEFYDKFAPKKLIKQF